MIVQEPREKESYEKIISTLHSQGNVWKKRHQEIMEDVKNKRIRYHTTRDAIHHLMNSLRKEGFHIEDTILPSFPNA